MMYDGEFDRHAFNLTIKIMAGVFLGLVGLAFALWLANPASARPNERWAQIQERANGNDPNCVGACMEDAMRRMKFFQNSGFLPADPPLSIMPFKQNCCGQADAYEADDWEIDKEGNTIAVLTCNEPMDCEAIPGKTIRSAGTKIKIPSNKIMVPGQPINNTGHGWVFLGGGGTMVICYSAPSGL